MPARTRRASLDVSPCATATGAWSRSPIWRRTPRCAWTAAWGGVDDGDPRDLRSAPLLPHRHLRTDHRPGAPRRAGGDPAREIRVRWARAGGALRARPAAGEVHAAAGGGGSPEGAGGRGTAPHRRRRPHRQGEGLSRLRGAEDVDRGGDRDRGAGGFVSTEYVFFSGKGGVGKTTMACATAVGAA